MDPKLKHMQQSWAENSTRYTDPIGITGRRPDETEFQITVNDVARKLDLSAHEITSILDVGCNNGYLLHRLNANAIYEIGVDFCFIPLTHARSTYPDALFCQAEAQHLPFPSDFFDRVLCYNMLHYLPSVESALDVCRECWRVLKRGGCMIVGDLFPREFQERIPEEKRQHWTNPARPFMHRMDNWLFIPVHDLITLFESLGASTKIMRQPEELPGFEYRLDVVVEKGESL